jgi:hypothetical protein
VKLNKVIIIIQGARNINECSLRTASFTIRYRPGSCLHFIKKRESHAAHVGRSQISIRMDLKRLMGRASVLLWLDATTPAKRATLVITLFKAFSLVPIPVVIRRCNQRAVIR